MSVFVLSWAVFYIVHNNVQSKAILLCSLTCQDIQTNVIYSNKMITPHRYLYKLPKNYTQNTDATRE